jgi:hypothetical protein
MAKSVINFDIINCVLLIVILIIVIVCCMKKEHYAVYGTPNCNSSNPCSDYRGKKVDHSYCSNNKWRVCNPKDKKKTSNFCSYRQTLAEKSKRPMKVCSPNNRGWKWFNPKVPPSP